MTQLRGLNGGIPPTIVFGQQVVAYGSLVLGVGFENAGCGMWDVGRVEG
jgi:hypothetical protein